MKLIRIYTTLLILFLSLLARGQQDVQLSQQHFSRININPSATEVSNYANAYLLVRQQWIGFEGAPSTQMFNLHGYMEEIRSSLGLSFINDAVGNNRYLNLMFAYAYHVKTGEESTLALGLSAGLVNRRFGGDLLTNMPELCPEIIEMLQNGKSVYRPDVNFGITYSTPKFAFGVSATHLTRYLYSKDEWFRLPLHGYAFIEYGIDFTPDIRFTPRAQLMAALSSVDTVSIMKRVDALVDLGGTVSFKDKFWFGGSFRFYPDLEGNTITEQIGGSSFTAMVGIHLGPNLRVGYSYDYRLRRTFQNINTYGSHEIMFNYRMRVTEVQTAEATPRFFE
jgi:type IX secretion system PorP/SprF family membrane protein